MKINRYNQFIIESILYTSPEFNQTLKKLSGTNIADQFISLINKDIKTKFNFLNLTDKNDTISFVSDNQATNKLKSGSSIESLFGSNGNKTTIGRIFRAILKDNNISFNDIELEQFVNKFKAEYDKKTISESEVELIRIVKGEDIKYWYNSDTYAPIYKGTLSNSCMRYDNCSSYFDIYTQSKNVSMVIQVNDEDKLISRAILWDVDSKTKYLDRIYYTNDSDQQLLLDWVIEKFPEFQIDNYRDNEDDEREIILDIDKIPEEFPYMDTMVYFFPQEKKLTNSNPDDKKGWILQSTTGGYSSNAEVYTMDGEYHDRDDCVYSNYYNEYILRSDAVFSDYLEHYLYRPRAKYSNKLLSWIPSNITTKVIIDKQGNTDYYLADSDDIVLDEFNNYYLRDLMVETIDGDYILPEKGLSVYKIDIDNTSQKYFDFYLITSDDIMHATKLDTELFNLKYHDEESIVSKRNYYNKLYRNFLFKDLDQKLKGYDQKLSDQKRKEINMFLNVIRKHGVDTNSISDSTYLLSNNLVYENWGTNLNLIKVFSKYFQDNFELEIYQQDDTTDIENIVKKFTSDDKNFFKFLIMSLSYGPYSLYRYEELDLYRELLNHIKKEYNSNEKSYSNFRYYHNDDSNIEVIMNRFFTKIISDFSDLIKESILNMNINYILGIKLDSRYDLYNLLLLYFRHYHLFTKSKSFDKSLMNLVNKP